eukprot:symbB.v1.2.008561.t2/scaffold511.1/size325556/8
MMAAMTAVKWAKESHSDPAMAGVSTAAMTLQTAPSTISVEVGAVSQVAKEVRKLKKVLREIEALEDRSSGGADFFMTEIDRISTHLTSREGEQLLDSQMLKVQRKTEILDKLDDLTGWS